MVVLKFSLYKKKKKIVSYEIFAVPLTSLIFDTGKSKRLLIQIWQNLMLHGTNCFQRYLHVDLPPHN